MSDFANFPACPLKHEKNAAFGSHVALSVLQIDPISPDRSSCQSTTIGSPKPFPLLSPLILFPIFWSILGLEPLRGHQWDLLESIEGVLDPCRGHFNQKKLGPGLKYDFWPKPMKIQTLAITNPLRQTRGNRLHLKGPAGSHCSHGRFDT